MVMVLVSVLLSSTNCSTWRGTIALEIALAKSVIINRRTRKLICLVGVLHNITHYL